MASRHCHKRPFPPSYTTHTHVLHMSSGEEHSRKRRAQRSCDFCRQRKSWSKVSREIAVAHSQTARCDGVNTPNVAECSHCLQFGVSCTYLKPTPQRGPKSDRVLEDMRQQIAVLEAKLQSLSVCSLCSQPLHARPDSDRPTLPSIFHATARSDTASTDADRPAEDDVAQDELVDRFRQISIAGIGRTRPLTPGSNHELLRPTLDDKYKFLRSSLLQERQRHFGRPGTLRRRVYWDLLPWEKELYDERPRYVYPASDLIASLLELYFSNVHPTFPVLHRPSFERSVAEGLHLTDAKFGATLLAVLAVASRYSDDPRVLVDGETSLSSGWKFIAQVPIVRKRIQRTIYQVQFYCLMTLFSLGTSAGENAWLYLGLGIRFLQHRGEHRRKRDGHKFEDELWNRAFWSLFALDCMGAASLGRPTIIHMEDCDVEPPLEVDDEYWEQGFTQPPGKPSALSFFACFSRLCEILGDALRRLYASDKLKTRMGWTGTDWEQDTITELDSAMNAFLDSIPSHLRWDPERTVTGPFFDQSAILYVTYHYAQITIHRLYVHYLYKQNALAAPSLSICTSAARSALYIAHVWLDRLQRVALPFLQNPVFVSAVVLLLNFIGSKVVGVAIANQQDLAYVKPALAVLKLAESRSQQAGRLWEMLQEFLSLDCSVGRPPPGPESGKLSAMPGPTVAWPVPPTCPLLPSPGQLEPSVSFTSVAEEAHPQRGPSFEPGMSIEQLLTDTNVLDPSVLDPSTISPESESTSGNNVLDDEIMSMWMTAPTDFMNMDQWDTYIENMNVDINWSDGQ
ncbi:fungal-specific transcription factor domain-containing protein [Mycena maculata]|uniref:Fungal-specific transcription factor domain-containing protein n=1 Tax=Mycena maculata TaxID=230809 RepID=A0AAD7MRB4_9AGAR|nr:fungal-specific transcription factor domain-containing protein [Mycena maculata]